MMLIGQQLWVSDPVPYNAAHSPTTVSVVQILVWIAMQQSGAIPHFVPQPIGVPVEDKQRHGHQLSATDFKSRPTARGSTAANTVAKQYENKASSTRYGGIMQPLDVSALCIGQHSLGVGHTGVTWAGRCARHQPSRDGASSGSKQDAAVGHVLVACVTWVVV